MNQTNQSNQNNKFVLLYDSNSKIEELKEIILQHNPQIITFNLESHNKLLKNNIIHKLSEDYLNENDLEEFIKLAKTQKLSKNSWSIDVKKINKDTLDLRVKNPNRRKHSESRTPAAIFDEIVELDKKYETVIKNIKNFL